jgi:hypothetical protein
MNSQNINSYHQLDSAKHKPRISWNSEYDCYQINDGGICLYGNTINQAFHEISIVREK